MVRMTLGIDLGGSSSKATLIDESGAVIATASREYASYSPCPGWLEQDGHHYFLGQDGRVKKGIVEMEDGSKYLLKRLVALEGDTVGFTDGRLIVNGETVDEPYVRCRGSWNLEPVTVAPGKCFVVGDNRGQPAYEHLFGEVDLSRIIGGLLF